MWIVYLLKHSETSESYIGVTEDLARRIAEHNRGNQTSTHRLHGEWEVVYTESYRSKADAFERERKLKYHGSAKQKLLQRILKSLEG